MSLREWDLMVAELNGRAIDGTPGIRSLKAICEFFDAAYATLDREVYDGDCDTDGHYLCRECSKMSCMAAIEREIIPDPEALCST